MDRICDSQEAPLSCSNKFRNKLLTRKNWQSMFMNPPVGGRRSRKEGSFTQKLLFGLAFTEKFLNKQKFIVLQHSQARCRDFFNDFRLLIDFRITASNYFLIQTIDWLMEANIKYFLRIVSSHKTELATLRKKWTIDRGERIYSLSTK